MTARTMSEAFSKNRRRRERRTVQARSATLAREEEDDCGASRSARSRSERPVYAQLFLCEPLLKPSTIGMRSC